MKKSNLLVTSTLSLAAVVGRLKAQIMHQRQPCPPRSGGRWARLAGGAVTAVALGLAAVPVRSATLTYNFNNGTLQGWHNRVWDLSANAGAGGWVDLSPNVSAMPGTINGGAIAPASTNNNLFGNNGTQVDPVGGNTDNHLNTLWLRSPQFYLDNSGDLTVQMARGNANGPAPANDTMVSHIAADNTAATGWKGVALRRVSDGAFVRAKPRTDTGDAMITVTFTAAELTPYVGVKCTLDLINSERASWGWLSMDNVSIPGFGTQVLLDVADPLIVVGINTTVLVSIPDGSNATATVTVYVTNSNPGVLTINGSAAPVVPVVFAPGGAYSQDVTVVGTAVGQAQLTAGSAGLGSGSLALTVNPKLIGRWISGAANLSETSGYRPAGTHDGVAVGTPAALAFSSDLPPGCTGQSLDLRAGNVGVMVTNSATTDGGYLNTYDDVIRNKFTIAFWAKGFPGGWNPWVSKRGESIGWQLRRMENDPVAGFTLRGVDNEDGRGSSINVNDTSWHHFVGVWNQATGTRTLYVDGVLSHVVNNTVGQMMNLAAAKHLALGAREQGGTGFEAYFSGLLCDVRIYNIPLFSNQVYAVMTTPMAPDLSMGALSGVPATLQIIGGKQPPTDPNGRTLVVSAVVQSANATVTTDGSRVVYTAHNTYTGTDTFTYTVTNNVGGSATATVTVTVTANGTGFNLISGPVNNGNGTSTINFVGIPGYRYALETTAGLALPIAWTPVVTNTTGPHGQASFTFSTSAGQAYFRTRWVP